MAVSPKSLKNIEGHKFKPGQVANPKGRPKNRVNELLRTVLKKPKRQVVAFTEEEIATAERALLVLTLPELKALIDSDKTPTFIRGLAVAIYMDMKNGRALVLDRLRERQYKQQAEQHEVVVSYADYDRFKGLTDEQIERYIYGDKR